MDIKMIVCDLDGTLLNDESVVSEANTAALRMAAEQGVVVIAATGRSIHSALDLLRPVGVVSWALCSNGATRYDLAAEQLVSNTPIEAAIAGQLLDRIRADYDEIGLCWETEANGVQWDQTYDDHRTGTETHKQQRRSATTFPDGEDLIKLMITHPDMSHTEWLVALEPFIDASLAASTSGTEFVEITHASATKGQAVASLCEELGIEASAVVAFGDQMNDSDLLAWAGRGYAMANATEAIRAVAQFHAPHHADDGVAQVVTSLLAGE